MTNRKLNILFLPKWYPSKFEEFDGNFIENHAIALSKKCNLGLIFVHSDANLEETYKVDLSLKNGFPEFRVFYKRPSFGISLINNLVAFLRYKKAQTIGYEHYIKKIGEPDICHVHVNGKSALLATNLKNTKKIPFLITEHWSGYTQESKAFKGYFRKMFHRYTAKESSGITCVSNYLKKAVESHQIVAPFSIVPNVVDTELFQPNYNKSNNVTRIVHISNLTKTPKNIHLIAKALTSVSNIRTDFSVDIIGTGPDEGLMLDILENGNMKDKYTFHGEIELKNVAEILQNADFLLLYSQFETQSVVMIESFACGVPVLTSEVGGIPEYINEERGIIVEPNSVDTLQNGIIAMLNKVSQFDVKKIRNYAVRNFSEERIQEQFLSIYHNILNDD